MLKPILTGMLLMSTPLSAMDAPKMTCNVIADFSSADEAALWRTQNDNVMGGRSIGGPTFERGWLTFSGYTNMDGGGFSSIIADHAKAAFEKADAVRLTLKPDGRNYQLAFRTNARDAWRRKFAFRTPIPQTPVGEWNSVTISLQELSASIWGQPKTKAFDRTKVTDYGLFIYDGVTGPFSLEVKSIEVCKKTTNS